MKLTFAAAIALSLAFLASSLASQVPVPDRTARYSNVDYREGTSGGSVHVTRNTIEWRRAGESVLSHNMTDIAFAGGVCHVQGRVFLVVGVDSAGNGVILHIALSGPNPYHLEKLGVTTIPGRDIVAVAWNSFDDGLYIMDGVAGKVLHASWHGTAPMPGGGAFSVIADCTADLGFGSTIPAYLRMWSPTFFSPFDGLVEEAGVNIAHSGAPQANPRRLVWDSTSSTWEVNGTPIAASPTWSVRDIVLAESSTISVFGDTAGPFEIRAVAGGPPVATGIITQPGDWESVAISAQLEAGTKYEITGPGGVGQASRPFRPMVRFGNPVSASVLEASIGRANSGSCVVGSDRFAPVFDLEVDSQVPSQSLIEVNLWIAWREEGLPDPIVWPNPDVALLQAAISVPATIEVRSGQVTYPVGVVAPVPSDSGAEGTVLLFQFAAVSPDGQEVTVSDVFGTTVLPQPLGASVLSSGPSSNSVLSTRRNYVEYVWGRRMMQSSTSTTIPRVVELQRLVMRNLGR